MSGKARLIHDPKLLKEMALELTRHHEDSINSGWSLEEAGNLPDNLSKAITGVIIEVKKTEAVMKFNQNRSVEDQREVIKHLDDNYAPGVREIMERNLREK